LPLPNLGSVVRVAPLLCWPSAAARVHAVRYTSRRTGLNAARPARQTTPLTDPRARSPSAAQLANCALAQAVRRHARRRRDRRLLLVARALVAVRALRRGQCAGDCAQVRARHWLCRKRRRGRKRRAQRRRRHRRCATCARRRGRRRGRVTAILQPAWHAALRATPCHRRDALHCGAQPLLGRGVRRVRRGIWGVRACPAGCGRRASDAAYAQAPPRRPPHDRDRPRLGLALRLHACARPRRRPHARAGCVVPHGLLVTTISVGGALGRALGTAASDAGGEQLNERVFALVGATAFVAGTSHTTMAFTLILVELVNDSTYLVPCVVAALVARTVRITTSRPGRVRSTSPARTCAAAHRLACARVETPPCPSRAVGGSQDHRSSRKRARQSSTICLMRAHALSLPAARSAPGVGAVRRQQLL